MSAETVAVSVRLLAVVRGSIERKKAVMASKSVPQSLVMESTKISVQS